jgi:deoxyribodipyrimidine photolyase
VPAFLGAGARQFVFMLKGLQELAPRLQQAGIPFFLLQVGRGGGGSGSVYWDVTSSA